MANEFIARKGLIVLSNGASITGSLGIVGSVSASGNVTASNLQITGNANIDGDVVIGGNITVGNADIDVVKFLAEVSSSIVPVVNNAFDLGSGSKYWKDLYVSGTAYIGAVQANNINLSAITVLDDLTVLGNTTLGNQSTDITRITGSLIASGSSTFIGGQTLNGNLVLTGSNRIIYNTADDTTMLFGFYNGSSIYGPYFQIFGNNYSNAAQRGGAEFVYDTRNGGDANFHVSSFDGSTWVQRFRVDNNGAQVTGSLNVTDTVNAPSVSASFSGSGAQIFGIPNSGLVNSTIGITAGSGLSGGATVSLGSSTTVSLDTSSAHFLGGVKQKLNTDAVVSSSAQIDITATTGYSTFSQSLATVDQTQQSQINALIAVTGSYATTGSNTFTGIQTISDTTNSTNYTDGALVVAGGVGITKNVNISGSLNVLGLLTATSMSVQYVTSSQYVVGTSRIILNDDDTVRFAGISVVDSGSSQMTGSLYWDSFRNHWIYENESGSSYNSAILIAGPKSTGSLGSEVELISGRIPVASGGDHIDTNPSLTPLRVDGGVFHVESSQYVTGSVTASYFVGDGSQLTGIVTTLTISGSDDVGNSSGAVSLKTQALLITGSEGIDVTISGQSLTIAAETASYTNKGVAAFNSANFSVTDGQVTASAITFNGVPLNLGSSYAFGLQNITPSGASTTDQLNLQGGAIIHGILYSSGSNPDVDTGTEIVASVSTGSYDGAFFDYVVKNGANRRVGTVMVVWDNSGNTEHTDVSTNDIGTTTDVVFTTDILSGTARLKATVNTDNWVIKTAVRAI